MTEFRHDIRMQCAKLFLVFTGKSEGEMHGPVGGAAVDAAGSTSLRGWSTLDVDPETEKITGS